MNRRRFIMNSAAGSFAAFLTRNIQAFNMIDGPAATPLSSESLYDIFRNPVFTYHPFVRWWWNGNKVEAEELKRELRLLKDAGISGVEINPVEFPSRFAGDDLGKPSLKWLSEEWIDMLRVVFDEAKTLGMTCDLIVGSGWPFGAEYLEDEERARIVVTGIKKLKGPIDYEISLYEIFREADPPVSSPFPGRTMELMSLHLVPDPLDDLSGVRSLEILKDQNVFKISIPEGRYALYALVRINGFMQVINGAPGATGPVLDHYNTVALKKYLSRMADAIEEKTGPLSQNIRALFIDSMELEGANWTPDMMEEFKRRRGYDIYPFLHLILFKTGAMGNVTDFSYTAGLSPEIEDMVRRMRYDFELTKAEMLEERFIKTFTEWCRALKVKSRAQAYGRNFFPLESSFYYDIPESESWTMNWLKHRIGEEMPEDDYRRGRAYTMICKYVSSAANLTGKRIVSCEEMTDTYTVFNTTPENLKIGGDQSAITGVNQTVLHGFNYSPPAAPYPGWIRYGGYYNENNTWWPYFHLYNDYKARLSALLQNVTMLTNIAILPPNDDMWSTIGAQMEPFPSITNADYFTLVWEAINKNGNGCDYVSQRVISNAEVRNGSLNYGKRSYNFLFLIQIESLHPEAARKIYEFVSSGGLVFCIETCPVKSPGWKDHESKDELVRDYVEKMKSIPGRFVFLKKPEKDFIGWYRGIQELYGIVPEIKIGNPDPYLMANHYRSDDGSDIYFLAWSHLHKSHTTKITFPIEVVKGRQGWIWDPVDGLRYKIHPGRDNSIEIDFGPADSYFIVFDRNKSGPDWIPVPASGSPITELKDGWSLEFRHCRDGSVKTATTGTLADIKDMPDFSNFAGTIIYRNYITISDTKPLYLNLGKVYGISELRVNGRDCGVKWFGRRIFKIKDHLVSGTNLIEIKVTTTMGNYMKSLTDNPIAQYWTNEKNKIQPLQSMGLLGPVTLY